MFNFFRKKKKPLKSISSDTPVPHDEEMNYGFLVKADLPKGFKYPKSFIEYEKYNKKRVELEPYIIFGTKSAETFNRVVKEQYPSRVLVPFGKDNNSDDVFCFDGTDTSGNPKVYIVHTYASPGWEDKGYVEDFTAWLKFAQEAQDTYIEQREEVENYGV